MRFRVKPQDFVIFIIFCIFLLYLSSIAVLNVTELLNEGKFYGLLPFAGYKAPYLGATLVVFFSVLIVIFLSVSSHIFNREKGKGIGIELGTKETTGYSRWSTIKEMKTAPDVARIKISDQQTKAAGVALINNGKEMWVDNGENHTLVVGATASGKTTAVVDPLVQNLAKAGESIIITDPKGELYRNHYEMLKARGYNIIVLNFRDANMGNAWNPLALPYRLYKEGNADKAIELLEDVALNILHNEKTDDPFWQSSAADYFSGLALGLFEDGEEDEVHLNSINYMSTAGEERFASSNYIKEYFQLKGETSSPYIFASNTITAPNETKGSILSVFRQKIRIFSTKEQLSEMLSYSDFEMRDIGTKKTAVFMIIHDEKTTYHALATIFIKQCYETLIDVAQKSGGTLPFRTNFILDEFANMPPLKDVTAMVTAARSRKIRFTFIIQNFAQLNEVYGREDAQTIRSNCGNLIYLLTTELAALEEISKLCGEVKVKEKDKTVSKPLVSVSDLQKMKLNEVIILKNRLNPFRTKLTPSYEIEWGENYANGNFIERKMNEIPLFDIKTFVKTTKRNKLFDSLENITADQKKIPKVNMPVINPLLSPNEDKEEKPEKQEELEPETKKRQPVVSFNPLNDPYDSEQMPGFELFSDRESTESIQPDFNIEDLIKRIDAKIIELEKEENKIEQKPTKDIEQLNINEDDSYDKLEETIYEKFDDFFKVETPNEDNDSTVNIDSESKIVDAIGVTDDQFYDDFY